jgi:transcriptional regulator with XRE-family HTH domain
MSAAGDLLTSIGESLRATREQRGLTLEQAAELAGLSKSHLSRLESTERQPSVAALLALAEAYGVPLSSLFGENQGSVPVAFSHPGDVRRESNGLLIASCSGFLGSNVIDALRVTVSPDRPDPALVRHHGEEWLYILDGTLRLEYDGDIHQLEVGTTAHFNAELPHRLTTVDRPAEVLLVAAKHSRNIHLIH